MLFLFLLFGVGVAVALYFRLKPAPNRYFSLNEYWVYIPSAKMPPQDELMTRVLRENPAGSVIGPKEGLLMSDIRLHLALVLKAKNAYLFRPDLFEEHIEPTAEILHNLALSQSLVKIRYLSEEPLKNRANLQLLPHLAAAAARLADGKVIYDTVAERLYNLEALEAVLSDHRQLDQPQLQVSIFWKHDEEGVWAVTRGLKKIGLPELRTKRMDLDQKVLVTSVMNSVVEELWKREELPDTLTVAEFGDQFEIHFEAPKSLEFLVEINRIQTL